MHVCPMVTGVVPHVGGPILPPGAPTVLIDRRGATPPFANLDYQKSVQICRSSERGRGSRFHPPMPSLCARPADSSRAVS
jgi:hypothetical protein